MRARPVFSAFVSQGRQSLCVKGDLQEIERKCVGPFSRIFVHYLQAIKLLAYEPAGKPAPLYTNRDAEQAGYGRPTLDQRFVGGPLGNAFLKRISGLHKTPEPFINHTFSFPHAADSWRDLRHGRLILRRNPL